MMIEQTALIFKSLSEPIRLRILNLLSNSDEICVCDIVSILDTPQSVISRHLSYLKKNHLVLSRREGNWQHYKLATFPENHLFNNILETLKESLLLDTSCVNDSQQQRIPNDN